MKRAALLLLILALAPACYTTRIYVGASNNGGRVEDEWQQTFLWGIVSVGKVNAGKICGDSGVQSIKTQVGGLGLLANWVTVGIWIPVHVKVTCGG